MNFEHQTPPDTVGNAYAERWDGAGAEETNALFQWMSSNELMPVVLVVSLIIWLVFVFYLVRMDKKIEAVEKQLLNREN